MVCHHPHTPCKAFMTMSFLKKNWLSGFAAWANWSFFILLASILVFKHVYLFKNAVYIYIRI